MIFPRPVPLPIVQPTNPQGVLRVFECLSYVHNNVPFYVEVLHKGTGVLTALSDGAYEFPLLYLNCALEDEPAGACSCSGRVTHY